MFGAEHCFVSVSSSCFQSKITDLSRWGGTPGDHQANPLPRQGHPQQVTGTRPDGKISSRGRFQRDISTFLHPILTIISSRQCCQQQGRSPSTSSLGDPHSVHLGFKSVIIHSLFKVFIPTWVRFALSAKKTKIEQSRCGVASLG